MTDLNNQIWNHWSQRKIYDAIRGQLRPPQYRPNRKQIRPPRIRKRKATNDAIVD